MRQGADLLVSHTLTYTTRLVAEKKGLPWASSLLQPLGLLSRYDPPVLPAAPRLVYWLGFLGPTFWGVLFRMARRRFRAWGEPWHRLRAELGLPPTSADPIMEGQHSPTLVLALFSPLLARPQPDWPANTKTTGFPPTRR